MPIHSQRQRRPVSGLVTLMLMAGCATGTRQTPRYYEQSADSATSGCLRNPACYSQTGDEAVIPWLSRAVNAARNTTTVMQMVTKAELQRIETILTECASKAHHQVNDEDEELKGRSPDKDECKKVVRREGNREVTRAMELGSKKHALALACAREKLGTDFPDTVSVEPRYQKDPNTGRWRWLDPEQVAEWLRNSLTANLAGSLVPDIVVHASGNPNKAQRVYDLKFPCPSTNPPTWGRYAVGQPHHPRTQGQMYKEALRLEDRDLAFSTPLGIQR